MEVESEEGSRIAIENGHKTVFGRGLGVQSDDRTVSRRHVLLEAKTWDEKSGSQTGHKVSFEVIGKNPIWLRESGNEDIRVFRRGENGEVAAGDCLCLSGKRPAWFTVREMGSGEGDRRILGSENELAKSLPSELEFDGLDFSEIDPVKEFGFIVMGHEFDRYPRQMIRDMKHWDWFLEEHGRDNDNDEYLEKKGKWGVTGKRRKAEGNDGDVWTGESDDDKELVAKLRKVQRPAYSTRLKNFEKSHKEAEALGNSGPKNTAGAYQEDLEKENDNETLGGFIVDDDAVEQEEEIDEEEEEVFSEDDDNDDEEIDD